MRDDVSLHRVFQCRLVGVAEIGQCRIERIQLEEVAMTTDGRARAAVRRMLPIVSACKRAGRQSSSGNTLSQAVSAWRHVIENPMYPDCLWPSGIRCVRV